MKQLSLIMIFMFTISVQYLHGRTFSDPDVKLEGNELYREALKEQRMKVVTPLLKNPSQMRG